MQAVKIDEKRALGNLMDLLAIEGLSGSETRVAAAVKKKLRAAGVRPGWMRFDDAHKKIGKGYQMFAFLLSVDVLLPKRLG